MWQYTSVRTQRQNRVMIWVGNWLTATQPGGPLWNLMEFQKKSATSSSTEEFKLFSGYCKEVLEATTYSRKDAIRHVWSTSMQLEGSKLDTKYARLSAEALRRGLEFLKIVVDYMAGGTGFRDLENGAARSSHSIPSSHPSLILSESTTTAVSFDKTLTRAAGLAFSMFQSSVESVQEFD